MRLRSFDHDLTEAKTSLSQQQERAAIAETELFRLRTDVVKQGARDQALAGAPLEKLTTALRPYSGQAVEVRFGVTTMGMLQRVPEPASLDVLPLATLLIQAFESSKWDVVPAPFISTLQGPPGITVQISNKATVTTSTAAKALVAALQSVAMAAQGPFSGELKTFPRLGHPNSFLPDGSGGPATLKTLNQQTDQTIVLVVLAHP